MAVDVDFSSDDGLSETRHVYLLGNSLPVAWRERDAFVISELGFGTGLNLLATMELAFSERSSGRRVPHLVYQSVEWLPRSWETVAQLASRWPQLEPFVRILEPVYEPIAGWNRWTLDGLEVVLYVGDARDLVASAPTWKISDAWFLDGYAPDRGPELWDSALLDWVGKNTKVGGTASTYSAAGVVKRGLRGAGFQVVRAPGWGAKRHMVRAVRAPDLPNSSFLTTLYIEPAILK